MENLKLGPALPERLRAKCLDLFIRKHQAFGVDEFDLGHTDSYVHRIELGEDKTPVFDKQFQLSEHALSFFVCVWVLDLGQSRDPWASEHPPNVAKDI